MKNTGITVRGFELWAEEPNHYRHGHILYLRLPSIFQTEVREFTYSTKTSYEIGFVRPDGQFQSCYSGKRTREDTERARIAWDAETAILGCEVNVGYKRAGGGPLAFCTADDPLAVAWGTTIVDDEYGYAPLNFDLTPTEALKLIRWREQADAEWFAANPGFLPREAKILEAQVAGLSPNAAEFLVDAVQGFGPLSVAVLTGAEGRGLLECFECGAVYTEPGSVEVGGMSCERCAPHR